MQDDVPRDIPIILIFNRLINTNNATRYNPGNSNTNSQMAYHRSINYSDYDSITNNINIAYPQKKMETRVILFID